MCSFVLCGFSKVLFLELGKRWQRGNEAKSPRGEVFLLLARLIVPRLISSCKSERSDPPSLLPTSSHY